MLRDAFLVATVCFVVPRCIPVAVSLHRENGGLTSYVSLKIRGKRECGRSPSGWSYEWVGFDIF